MPHIHDFHEEFTALVGEIGRYAVGTDYVFRGENKKYDPPMSSTLYREYAKETVVQYMDLETIQSIELVTAQKHAPDVANSDELLQLIQHHQGKTNLVDFTRDLNIALFFACDGEPCEDGQVYLVSETQWQPKIVQPTVPANRVISQKSVFIAPPIGYIPIDGYAEGPYRIPKELKIYALHFLRTQHGISRSTIYNDLHGFIGQRRFVREAIIAIGEGIHHSNSGDVDAAMSKFDTAISHDPENSHAWLFRAQALQASNPVNSPPWVCAKSQYSEAIRLQPKSYVAYHNRGYAHLQSGNLSDAIADLRTALRLQPNYAEAHNTMGLALLESNHHSVAAWHFQQAVTIEPDHALAYNNLGTAYQYLGQNEMAIHHYEQALRLNPSLQTASENLSYARSSTTP